MVGTSGSTWCKPKFQVSGEIVQCVFPGCEKVMRRDKFNSSHYVKETNFSNVGHCSLRKNSLWVFEIEFYTTKMSPNCSSINSE